MKNSRLIQFLIRLEIKMVKWSSRNCVDILRVALGLVFIWFGILKFFPGYSPAEVIAGKTIRMISFGYLKPNASLPILAIWECIIGLGLITKSWLNLTVALLYCHILGTFLPLIFFPHETFNHSVFIPTLLGQYIIKNIVLLSGGIVVGTAVKCEMLFVYPKPKLQNYFIKLTDSEAVVNA